MSKMIKYVNGQLVEYEILKLVDQYDPILRQPTKTVDFNDPNVKAAYLAMSIAETLGKTDGLALAANQCGVPYRIFAMNAGDKIWMFINPKIIWKSEELANMSEGCLSFPGLYLKFERPASIEIEFQDLNGNFIKQKFDGLSARVIQHEMDHLDGVCFTDKISPIKLDMAKRKIKSNLKKMKRATTQGISAT